MKATLLAIVATVALVAGLGGGAHSGPAHARDGELQRTGRIAALSPGEELPLTIAWDAADGEPARVEYGRGWLALPG